LARYGRGGNYVTAKISGKTANVIAYFQLSDFAVQIRSAAKEFLPILGRVTLLINQEAKNVAKEEMENYIEFEKFFTAAMKQEKLINTITRIKHSLERGAIPNSNIQALLAKKREKKQKQRQAADSESSNILDFIYANLPADLEVVKKQAEKQTEEAKQLREMAKEERKALEKKKREDDQLAKEKKEDKKKKHQQQSNSSTADEEPENKKKTVTKTLRTTDEHGFVTKDKEYVRKDEKGEVESTMKASEKLKQDIEKEKEDQKSKKKVADTVGSDIVLQNNPFAVVKKAGGIQSAAELQAKVNEKRGAARNAGHNESQKERNVKAPPPPKNKPKKPKTKTPLKSSSPDSESESTTEQTVHSTSVGVNPQPVLIGAFAIAVAVLSYVFLLS